MGSNADEVVIDEDQNVPTYVGSMPVPNVQEMVVNHGVAKEVLQNMEDAAAEFFDLQIQEKNKFSIASDDIQGYGQARLKVCPTTPEKFKCSCGGATGGSISSIMGLEKDILLPMHRELMQALQKDDVDGLQIRHDGEWLPVKPIPNVLVMKIGDVIEIWSDAKNKSIEHRAVTNENKERISFASFLFPRDDVEIDPLDHVIDSSRPFSMYKKV
ncbi:hypothetical protein Acr_22g0003630 [Actinidia rufa]|uniref:2-oxoglutarate (2OG) and Fe(II)-dependent oxygenase superfamily protein n=1 Tax=Actinidia rufa TaxID=165716 RepID=A0A7J0GJL2_9ERIC|nr:hypothetical protein Acr_22g0003630 [Actinidia rufa]